MRTNFVAGVALLATCALPAICQEAQPKNQTAPVYRVTVVERSIQAVNYHYRGGPTRIDFQGTVLMPDAKGEAMVQSKRGRTEIEARFQKLLPSQNFGRQFLSYVLWAITPEGGPRNIGEIVPGRSNDAKLEVTTDLQAFAMIVTAEPYATVRQPSDVVVLENRVRRDTQGKIQEVAAKYELMPRGHFVLNKGTADPAIANAPKVSMSEYEALTALYQAQNAVGIATTAGAEQLASNTYVKAQQLLAEAQQLHDKGHNSKRVVQIAREATQTADDARTIAERRRQAEQVRQVQEAKPQAALSAPQAPAEPQVAPAEAANSGVPAPQPEPDSSRSEAPSTLAGSTAASEKTILRTRLLEQLNALAPTRDTPRGLSIALDEGAFQGSSLSQATTDRLARLATVVLAHPGTRIDAEGHSESASGEALSFERARAVREALMRRGIASVSARGFGNSRPLASGGKANQRVEIIISGDAIGTVPVWDRTYSLVPR